MGAIIFIITILVLVLIHEFGHFIAAKRAGIRVDEFGFGFPPRLFSFKKGETTYSFNLIPFGGFVKIFGETPDDKEDYSSEHGPDHARSLISKPRSTQAVVMIAGVAMNFLLGWILLSGAFISGMPTAVSDTPRGAVLSNTALYITSVKKDSPAFLAHLSVGDKIISLSYEDKSQIKKIENPDIRGFQQFVEGATDKNISLLYSHAGVPQNIQIVPQKNIETGKSMLGVSIDMIGMLKLPFHQAVYTGLKTTWHMTVGIALSLAGLVKNIFLGNANFSDVSGPIGIIGIMKTASEFGFAYLVSFIALISLNLAVINLIPFPALDGGRVLFLIIESIKGSRINPKIANTLNNFGFMLLILLMLVVTYHDIIKLWKPI